MDKSKKWSLIKWISHGLLLIPLIGELLFELVKSFSEKVPEGNNYSEEIKNNSRLFFERISNVGHFTEIDINLLSQITYKNEKYYDFLKLIEEHANNNIYHSEIIAEGGYGKTTTLLHVWKHYLNIKRKISTIPIFIQLNEYNNYVKKDNNSNFIISYICKNYLNKIRHSDTDTNNIWEIMTKKIKVNGIEKPSVILLLDGFNEISVDKEQLIVDLNEIMSSCIGVQVLITSRYEIRQFLNWELMDKIKLNGLEKETIIEYFEKNNINFASEKIIETLQNPMMLILYLEICKSRSIESIQDIETRGQLIKLFFIKQNHLYNTRTIKTIKLVSYRIAIDYILPLIGYTMEVEGKFTLKFQNFKKLINVKLEKIFDDIDNYEEKFINLIGVESIKFLNNYYIDEIYNLILKILIDETCIIVFEKSTYRFSHQILRDYFSAIYILIDLEAFLDGKSEVMLIDDRKLSIEIMELIGDIADENNLIDEFIRTENVDVFKKSIFNIFLADERIRKSHKLSLYNVLNIINIARKGLFGIKLYKLDLNEFVFNNIVCSKNIEGTYLYTQFEEANINMNLFLPQGHIQWVYSVTQDMQNENIFITGGRDGWIKEWDNRFNYCKKNYLGHNGSIMKVVISSDGKKIYSASSDKTIREWSRNDCTCSSIFKGHSKEVNDLLINPFESTLLSCSSDGSIIEWDLETNREIRTIVKNREPINSIKFDSKYKKLLITTQKGLIEEWDYINCRQINKYQGNEASVNCALYGKKDNYILSASDDKTIRLWSCSNQECIHVFIGHTEAVKSIHFNNNFTRFLSSSSDKTIIEWDFFSRTIKHVFKGHNDSVFEAKYYKHNENIIFSCSRDFSMRIWSRTSGQQLYNYSGVSYWLKKFSVLQNMVYIPSSDGSIKKFDIITGDCVGYFLGHKLKVCSVDIFDNILVSASLDGTIKLWDIKTEKCFKTFTTNNISVDDVCFISVNSIVAVLSNNDIMIIDTRTEDVKIITPDIENGFNNKAIGANAILYDANRNVMISTHWDGRVLLWNSINNECILKLKGHTDWVYSAQICNNVIFTSSRDGLIICWDIDTGEQISNISLNKGSVYQLVISTDKTKLFAAFGDGSIVVISTDTYEVLYEKKLHESRVFSIKLMEEEDSIITYSEDGKIKKWCYLNDEIFILINNYPGIFIKNVIFNNIENIDSTMQNVIKKYGGRFINH